jgi:hypothetical protein
MNNSLFVGGCQSMNDLDRVVDRFANRQRAALKHLAERATFQQLGYQIRRAFECAEAVNDKNVGVVQSRSRLRLLLETPQPIRILRNKGREDLDRHFTF